MADPILAKLEQIYQVVEATRRFGTTINNPVAAVAAATTQPPDSTAPGIVTRNIPSGNQNVSVNNFPANLSNDNVVVVNTPTVVVSNFPPPVTSIAVNNFPAPLASVAINNFPPPVTSVAVSNFPAPVTSVAVSNFPPPVTSVAVNNFPAVQAVRELKDTGRQSVLLSWELVAGTTAEALTNFTNGSRNGVALAAASSYTVSAGKTLRIQSVMITFGANGSSAANYRVHLRQGAPATAASPVIFSACGGGPSNSSNPGGGTIADGIDIPAGQQIAMTHLDSTTGGILSVAIIGFEY